jgi:hypothetical protein
MVAGNDWYGERMAEGIPLRNARDDASKGHNLS